MPTGRSRASARALLLLAALLAVCVCLGIGLGVAVGLSSRADGVLGPAAGDLGWPTRSLLGAYLWLRQGALDLPAGDLEATVDLEVEPGESAASVVERLDAAGIVRDPFLLKVYLRYRGFDVGVQAGHYRVAGSMSVRELASTLQSARPLQIQLVIPEGWRREQIAGAIAASGLELSADDFLTVTGIRPPGFTFSSELPDPPSVEGFLFPDTYSLDPDIYAEELVLEMLDNFESRVGSDLRAGFGREGLSLFRAVSLASIVEREAAVPEERPLIASVFLNRLAAGMRLESDPTVQYALGRQPDGGWWKSPLTLEDLAFDSPYNTYLYPGLPPGPIANPGLASLEAVAFPADSEYLYFRALCDGSGRHAFARTFEEHLGNACP